MKLTKKQKKEIYELLEKHPEFSINDIAKRFPGVSKRAIVGCKGVLARKKLRAKASQQKKPNETLEVIPSEQPIKGPIGGFSLTPSVAPSFTSQTPPSTPQNIPDITLQAFQLFDTGYGFVDVMADLKLDYNQTLRLLKIYNQLKDEEAKREALGERYVNAWFAVAKIIGESIRDGCEHYNDETGACNMWILKDVDPKFRRKFPGIIKSVGKRLRLRVIDHPEICSICKAGG